MMKSVQEMVNDLKANPHLKLVVDQLEQEMAVEEKKRNEYYALIHEDVKAQNRYCEIRSSKRLQL